MLDAADSMGDFARVEDQVLPFEIAKKDLPLFALDPREEEPSQGSTGANNRIYTDTTVRLIAYIAVESGDGRRADARKALDDLWPRYIKALLDESQRAEKTARTRQEVRQGERPVMVDALVIEWHQDQEFL